MTSRESRRTAPSGSVLTRAIGFIIAALALALVPLGTSSVSAAPELPPSSGWVRFGHFAPSVDDVDVLVDGAPFASAISFRSVSDYMPLPVGPHTFEVRAAGDAEAAPLLTVEAGVPDNGSLTVGAVSTRDGLAPQVYSDQLVQPAEGTSLVRFIHAAPDVQAVDVTVVGGPALATDVPYPAATDYQDIAPGAYDVEVRNAGTGDVVLRVKDWTIEPGVQASIVIVRGADGQIDVAPVRDAVAAAFAPTGGIQTGGGAMADVLDPVETGSSAGSAVPFVFGGLLTLAGIAVLGGSATRRTRRST